jgi:predicted nuclease of restriction endonuclease-like RecB superfamily
MQPSTLSTIQTATSMTEFETRFLVSLSEREIEIILAYLDPDSLEPTHELIERLERRLSARKKELKDLEELMAQPDYQVGI